MINWENVHTIGHWSRPVRELDTLNDPADMAAYVARNRYAWPGGYELVLITDDGGALCIDCVRDEYENIYREAIRDERGSGWKPAGVSAVGVDIDYDDTLHCDHCGRAICKEE